MNGVPPSKACSFSLKLGAHNELARYSLPKRQQSRAVLPERRGPSPRCSPHHSSRRGRSRIMTLTTSQWPLPILEHVQANVEPRRIGGGETRASSWIGATTTSARPMGAAASTSTSLRSVLAGAYLSRSAALPLHESCGMSVGRPFARSRQRYLRSMMGG